MQENNPGIRTVLITGATGNVGSQVIRHLTGRGLRILAGMRNPSEQHPSIAFPDVTPVLFDFAAPDTFAPALAGIDVLFLLRPPQLADVPRYFAPLIGLAKRKRIGHIVFLSVQGAGGNRFIPHHKIEQLIMRSEVAYTLLRPAYFMQNFTTTLLADLQNKQQVFLPAGKAKFTLVDLRDVGAVAAAIILNPLAHHNKAYELTSSDQLDFAAMTGILSQATGNTIRFVSPSLFYFFMHKRKEGLSPALIAVMIMLHYLPRFQKTPAISNAIKEITGKEPISFARFAQEHAALFSGNRQG